MAAQWVQPVQYIHMAAQWVQPVQYIHMATQLVQPVEYCLCFCTNTPQLRNGTEVPPICGTWYYHTTTIRMAQRCPLHVVSGTHTPQLPQWYRGGTVTSLTLDT